MKTTLPLDLDLGAGMSRLAAQLMDKAEAALKGNPASLVTGVHEARKALKKTRALLRLMRSGLDADVYEHANAQARDIASSLSSCRDAVAMRAALDRLTKAARERGGGDAAAPYVAMVAALDAEFGPEPERKENSRAAGRKGAVSASARKKSSGRAAPRKGAAMDQVARMRAGRAGARAAPPKEVALARTAAREAADLRAQLAATELQDDGAKVVAKGVRKAFKKARRSLDQALSEPTAECLHEWRKQMKHLWYMAAFLGDAWRDVSAVDIDDLERVAEALGDEHDLWMLRELAVRRADVVGAVNVARFLSEVEDQRTRLRTEAIEMGRRMLRKRPSGLKKRLREQWDEQPDAAAVSASRNAHSPRRSSAGT